MNQFPKMIRRLLEQLTNLAAEDLAPGEEIIFSTKRAWYHEGLLYLVSCVSLIAAVVVFAGAFLKRLTGFLAVMANLIGGLCLVSSILFSVNAILTQYSVRYFLTDRRIIKRTGVFTKKITSIEYEHIQNTRVEKNTAERLVDMGDIYIDTAGGSGPEIIIENIHDPERMYRLILENMHKGKK